MKINLFLTSIFLFSFLFYPNIQSSKETQKTLHRSVKNSSYDSSNTNLWHDLITPDLNASKNFYGKIFNWTFSDVNFKGLKYTTIYNKGKIIGGMIEIKSAKNSTWISSLPLSNEDLSERIKSVVGYGAKVLLPPVKLPGRGKQIVFEGMQGEEFSLISENEYTSKMDTEETEGNWFGIELWATDVVKAKEFYEKAFEVDIEKTVYNNKDYWLFSLNSKILAGMINNPVINQGSQWVPYIKINDPSKIISKVEGSSGSILLAPSTEFREGKIGIIEDPHGAIIAIQKK